MKISMRSSYTFTCSLIQAQFSKPLSNKDVKHLIHSLSFWALHSVAPSQRWSWITHLNDLRCGPHYAKHGESTASRQVQPVISQFQRRWGKHGIQRKLIEKPIPRWIEWEWKREHLPLCGTERFRETWKFGTLGDSLRKSWRIKYYYYYIY